jgi:O-antigen/teichoic acid export membrane protein
MAIWITLSGLAVTALVIILFMPKYSYWAAAFGHLASYVVMFVVSAVLGAKYYPIPYRWGRLGGIFLLMGAVYLISLLLDISNLWIKLGVHTVRITAYACAAWFLIRGQRNTTISR